jgi:transposase
MATAILLRYPTAVSFSRASITKLAQIRYDGSHYVGEQLARALITTAKISVAQHHSEPLKLQVRYACRDINVLRRRICDLEADIERGLDAQEIGKLLTSVDGIGPQAAAIIIAEVGDPARFRRRRLGKLRGRHSAHPVNDSSPTAARPHLATRVSGPHWMPTLAGIRCNPWLRRYYWRLRTAGKRPKSRCSRPCTNSSQQSTASPSTDSHSFFHSCHHRPFRLPWLPRPRPDPPRGRGRVTFEQLAQVLLED